ncbi:type IV pilus twitching motility protein PilT [Patescibacteria group bacterium]
MEAINAKKKLKSFLAAVVKRDASDLHLAVDRHPTIRVDGKLIPITEEDVLTASDTKLISNVLIGAKDRAAFEDKGHIGFSFPFEKGARFRVNVFLQKGNVGIVMRLVQTDIRTLEELNIDPGLYDFAKFSQGLVLITGPVGHGKSTTMAAMVDYINHNYNKHIITVEDPIEYVYEQDQCIINQREVGGDVKSFPSALRAVFREDANVVLIGELRDLDTISTTMTAAETGHLIFGTLHTNNSAQTIDRIVDVFPAHQQNQIRSQLSSVLLGVVSQRLVPKIGGGRIPAIEVLIKNHAIENLIRENRAYQIDSVIETSLQDGMISLDRSLSQLVQKGLITMEDAFTFSNNRDYLKTIIKQ